MNARGIALAILWGGATAAAAASPGLREIGHIAVTDDVCTNVVVHANSAIAGALRDDAWLAKSIERLRAGDIEENRPGRPAALAEIAKYAGAIADETTHGRAELKRILDNSSGETATGHASDARAFATALGSAIERQAAMGRDLDDFVHAAEVAALRPSDADADADRHVLPPASIGPHARGSVPLAASETYAFREGPRSPTLRGIANDLEKHLAAVAADESRAQTFAEAAVTGC